MMLKYIKRNKAGLFMKINIVIISYGGIIPPTEY